MGEVTEHCAACGRFLAADRLSPWFCNQSCQRRWHRRRSFAPENDRSEVMARAIECGDEVTQMDVWFGSAA